MEKVVGTREQPNLDFIYSRGNQAALDAVVMISFSPDYMGYMYYNDAKLYVIDLRHRQVLRAAVPTKVGNRHDFDIGSTFRAMLEETVAAFGTEDAADVKPR